MINFGAVIEVELDWLGPPAYSRQSFTFKIETPWWLPDVSVRFEHHSGTPRLSQMQVASTPLIGAAALPPATRAAMPIGTTALLGSGEAAVLTLDQLRAAGPATVSDAAYDGLAPVATDSRIMLDFKPSLDAPVTVVPDTPDDVGVQTSGEVSARYELVQLGVRRRKRFGPGAGVWTDLLTPESTRIDTPEDVTAVFNSASASNGTWTSSAKAGPTPAVFWSTRTPATRSAPTIRTATTSPRRRSPAGHAATPCTCRRDGTR